MPILSVLMRMQTKIPLVKYLLSTICSTFDLISLGYLHLFLFFIWYSLLLSESDSESLSSVEDSPDDSVSSNSSEWCSDDVQTWEQGRELEWGTLDGKHGEWVGHGVCTGQGLWMGQEECMAARHGEGGVRWELVGEPGWVRGGAERRWVKGGWDGAKESKVQKESRISVRCRELQLLAQFHLY